MCFKGHNNNLQVRQGAKNEGEEEEEVFNPDSIKYSWGVVEVISWQV